MKLSTQCNMRLDEGELRRFRRVAKRLGLSVSDTIRYLMKWADDELDVFRRPR